MKFVRCSLFLACALVSLLSAQERVENAETDSDSAEQVQLRTIAGVGRLEPERLSVAEANRLETLRRRVPLRIQNLEGAVSQYRLTDLQGNDLAEQLAPRQEGAGLIVDAAPVEEFIITSTLLHSSFDGLVSDNPRFIRKMRTRRTETIPGDMSGAVLSRATFTVPGTDAEIFVRLKLQEP